MNLPILLVNFVKAVREACNKYNFKKYESMIDSKLYSNNGLKIHILSLDKSKRNNPLNAYGRITYIF